MFRWPTDYDRLDGGSLWIRPDLADRFARVGWNSLAGILGSDRIRYLRLRSYFNGWDTGNALLPADTNQTGNYLHVKRFRPGWGGCARGLIEANVVGLFESHGIDCMRIAAVGQTTWRGRIGGYCSVFISEQVGTGESAWSLLERTNDEQAPVETSRRRQIVISIAGVVARMHAADLYHGDLKWKHLLPDPSPDQPDAWRLIDLERAGRRTGPLALNAWVTDLWKVRRSMEQLRLTPEETTLWFVTYDELYAHLGGRFRGLAALRDDAVLWRTRLINLRRPIVRLLQPARRRTTRLPGHTTRAGSS